MMMRGFGQLRRLGVCLRTVPSFSTAVKDITRDILEFDVVVVGAGPAGLSAAIRLKQLESQIGRELNICVLEKGAEVGAHILSGCCFDPRALDELYPDWRNEGSPVVQEVTKDKFMYLTEDYALPSPLLPSMQAEGCYVISLGLLTRWLGERAADLGVEIYAGFSAAEPLYNENGAVRGVRTGDMGIGKDGEPKDGFTPGVDIVGRQTIFAEGCRGSCSKKVMEKFDLNKDSQEQTYALGVKELWSVDPSKHQPGLVLHTGGWPLGTDSFGGSFLYHAEDNKVHCGFVVGLDYSNPYLSIYDEFQRWKTHPAIRDTFEGGERIAYGARTITEGGLQCLPKLHMPGAMLAGDSAGTLVAARIKGAHTAMKMGMMSAEAIAERADEVFSEDTAQAVDLDNFASDFKESWVHAELYKYRNFRPAVNNYGFYVGSGVAAFDQFVARGKLPFTLKFKHEGDHHALKETWESNKIEYPKADGKLTFDLLTNLIMSGTNHEEDQPVHLHVDPKNLEGMKRDNHDKFAGPEGRYCPARVYEWLKNPEGQTYLQINASNCLHCKACSIKDCGQRIEWRVPEGGGGPQYSEM